ncbi:TonB-dependent receptor plug domain-containing protein [Novosphingobium resinovorum]
MRNANTALGQTSQSRGMMESFSVRSARALLLAGAAVPLFLAAPAMAQGAPTPADEEPVNDIVVTGSRIVGDGYSAPTPVAVLGEADIAAQAPANISDFVNQMPAIAGSGTSGTNSGGLSNAGAGINSIGLRGLGVGRTLVLVDGQRSVASTVGGTVDINTIPQDLVKRVEVITGGASAAYGSDAVGGVVNFILDTGYKGFKIGADTGISTYGDAFNYRFTGTAGFSLLDDRLHLLTNVSYFKQNREEGSTATGTTRVISRSITPPTPPPTASHSGWSAAGSARRGTRRAASSPAARCAVRTSWARADRAAQLRHRLQPVDDRRRLADHARTMSAPTPSFRSMNA